MTTSIIAYRNPVEQWFWEGGWLYVTALVFAVAAVFWAWSIWGEYRAKQRRKKRWMQMNEAQRAAWRHYNRRNNFEAEEWEK
jgi:hypothetical protein